MGTWALKQSRRINAHKEGRLTLIMRMKRDLCAAINNRPTYAVVGESGRSNRVPKVVVQPRDGGRPGGKKAWVGCSPPRRPTQSLSRFRVSNMSSEKTITSCLSPTIVETIFLDDASIIFPFASRKKISLPLQRTGICASTNKATCVSPIFSSVHRQKEFFFLSGVILNSYAFVS